VNAELPAYFRHVQVSGSSANVEFCRNLLLLKPLSKKAEHLAFSATEIAFPAPQHSRLEPQQQRTLGFLTEGEPPPEHLPDGFLNS
jgi:hypothetical protein